MFKSFSDYTKYLWIKSNQYKPTELHHLLPVSCNWGNYQENIAKVLKTDHRKIHETLDIPFRKFNWMVRKQRERENWKVLLLESDIEWRADIQRAYLEKVPELQYWRMKDMHDIKMWDIAKREFNKFNNLTWESYSPELWDVFQNHQLYVDTQKEISKEIQRLIRK